MICSEIGTNKPRERKKETLAETQITAISGDRRGNRRYNVELPLEYAVLHNGRVYASGLGTTVDISSTGMSFLPEANIEPGMFVEVVVQWPVSGAGECPMELAVVGTVVRSEGGAVAIRNVAREFRSQTAPMRMASGFC